VGSGALAILGEPTIRAQGANHLDEALNESSSAAEAAQTAVATRIPYASKRLIYAGEAFEHSGGLRFRMDARRRRILAAADLLSAFLGTAVATAGFAEGAWVLMLAGAPLWILLAKILGLYDRDHRAIRHLTLDELPGITAWATGATIIIILLLKLIPGPGLTTVDVIAAWAVIGAADIALRGTARWLWRWLTSAERTLIAGAGEPAEAIHRRAALFHDMHLDLVNDEPLALDQLQTADGRLAPSAQRIDRLIVAATDVSAELIGWLVAACRVHQVKLNVVSPMRGRALPVRLSEVAALPVFEFNTWDRSRSTTLLKRGFDLAASIPGLLFTALLLPVIALAIRWEGKGPIFFSQVRAGIGGRPFRLYKFRTMQPGAEDNLPVVDLDELEEPMFKLNDDPRVTRVGRILRRLSLDELPQFYNVLRGDMSIVGPRPEQVELVERYAPEHLFRLDVKPGITGPMQVHGRGDLTFAERLAVELDYVENMSFARDLHIVARTVPTVIRGRGAY
jgi:exopolysaccharide biosynthesis polyprenyl glycosylphosphotransferase